MISKKKLLLNTRFYLIADIAGQRQQDVIYRHSQKALRAGVKIIQLRCKTLEGRLFLSLAQRFKKIAHANKALLIINDRIDIAGASGADGVHLGQSDLPLACARSILGRDKIVGKSTHSLKQALEAQSEGADYIGYGPVFRTQTKPDSCAVGLCEIALLVKKIKIPLFAIGGIDQKNIGQLTGLGVKRVAVSSAVLSGNNPPQAVVNFNRLLL